MVSPSASDLPAAERSASMSRSTSKGWARVCSSGVAPWTPTARSPRSWMRSVTSLRDRCVGSGRRQLPSDGDELTAWRAHLTVEQLLEHGDGLWAVVEHLVPQQVAAQDPHQPVAHLLLVHQQPLARG